MIKENLLQYDVIEIGCATKNIFSVEISDKDRNDFYQAVNLFLLSVTKKLLHDLPLGNRILLNMQRLHGQWWQEMKWTVMKASKD